MQRRRSAARSTEEQGGLVRAPDGYRDLERLPSARTTLVFTAIQDAFVRLVVLKFLATERLKRKAVLRFQGECKSVGRVSHHASIVTVFEAGANADGLPFIAMEHCPRGSLADEMDGSGPVDPARVVDIGVRMAGALEFAHAHGVLHCDVKPQNILVRENGDPVLADFGIARLVESVAPGRTLGYTPMHAAPEVMSGSGPTAASDVYSLGSTLYTLLAGQPAYALEAGRGDTALIARIMRDDLPDIARSDVPRKLTDVLRTAMASEPDARFASAHHFAEALRAFESSRGGDIGASESARLVGSPPAGVGQPGVLPLTDRDADATQLGPGRAPRAPTRRRRWPIVLGAAAVVAVGGTAGALMATKDPVGGPTASATPTGTTSTQISATPLNPQDAEALLPSQVQVEPGTGAVTVSWVNGDRATERSGLSITTTRADTGEEVREPVLIQPPTSVTFLVSDLAPGVRYCFALTVIVISEDRRVEGAMTEPVCATPQ